MENLYLQENKVQLGTSVAKIPLIVSLCFLLYLQLFTNNEFFFNCSIALTIFSFLELLFALGKKIPVKESTTLLMVLQLLLTPYMDYYYLKAQGISFMAIPSESYFSYAFPAVLAFVIGLRLPIFSKNDFFSLLFSDAEKKDHSTVGILLIIIGYLFFGINRITSVAGLDFIIYVLSLFRFVGLLYLLYSKNKYLLPISLAVMVPAAIITVQGSVFIDFIIWLYFIYAFAAMRYQFKFRTNAIVLVTTLITLLILQTVKIQYRRVEWGSQNIQRTSSGLDLFIDLFSKNLSSLDDKALQMMQNNMIIRMNQGWIVSHVIKKKDGNPYVEQKKFIYDELLGLVLPRFLFQDKATVGDNAKFRYLTGLPLNKKVAMNVGILGDGYSNFGFWGGILFCGIFGLFINFVFAQSLKISRTTPSMLFWIPLILFYAMRAGNEFYIIANWTIKVSIIVWAFFWIAGKFSLIKSRIIT